MTMDVLVPRNLREALEMKGAHIRSRISRGWAWASSS
jgi:hypothetical protein